MPLGILDSLTLWFLRATIFVLRLLPRRVLFFLTGGIASLIGRLSAREIALNKAQLRFAFPQGDPRLLPKRDRQPLTENEIESSLDSLSRQVFRHAGVALAEALIWDRILERSPSSSDKTPYSTRERFKYLTAEGEDIVYNVINSNQAHLALSGHIGCFELAAAYLAACGMKMSVIGRQPNYAALDVLLKELRAGYGVESIWRDGTQSAREIISAVKNHRVIAALLDQDTNIKNGFAPFFGLPAASPLPPLEMAVRYRLPVITTFVVRIKPGYHHLITERIDYSPDDPNAAKAILESYNKRLERLISKYPDQWMWWHRRWRRRPELDYAKYPEKLPGYEQYLNWISVQAKEAATHSK